MASNDTVHTVPLLINGQEIHTSNSFQVVSPFERECLVWQASSATQTEALAAVHAAREAFLSWSTSKPAFRRDILLRVADILSENSDEYQGYMVQETGASSVFTEFNVKTSCEILRDCAGRISSALTGTVPCAEDADSHAMVVKEPYGVVLGIAPW